MNLGNISSDNNPWVEKYRPTDFDDIVLDSVNKTILMKINLMRWNRYQS